MTVGERIKEARKKKKLSQVELAKRCGLRQTTISAAETGVNQPTTTTIALIADVLGCTVAELLGEAPAGAPAAMELTAEERQLILDFRQLNEQGAAYVLQSVAMALELSKGKSHALANVGVS